MMPKGFPGRLSRGAGTHLASWLQETSALSATEGQALLDSTLENSNTVRGDRAQTGLFAVHGKQCGHSKRISQIAVSGDIIATKDPTSLRLWRARGDFALLRVVACRGTRVAFHPNGQFIVTGNRTDDGKSKSNLKIWGPSGGGAHAAGKKSTTVGGRDGVR